MLVGALVALVIVVIELRSDIRSLRRAVEQKDACIRTLERNLRLAAHEPKLSCPSPAEDAR